MKREEFAFVAVLNKDELDHVTRCAYADWLLEHDRPEEADRQRKYVPSRKWMLEFAKKHHCDGRYHDWEKEEREGLPKDGMTAEDVKKIAERYYQEVMELLKGHVGADQHGGFFDFDLPWHKETMATFYSDEMWGHFEVLTGLKAPAAGDPNRKERPSHFRRAFILLARDLDLVYGEPN